LFHADGRTDMTKLIVAFRNFAKLSLHTTLRDRGGVETQFHSFLILPLDKGGW